MGGLTVSATLYSGGKVPNAAPPARYRSLMTLLALAVIGSLVCSAWLMPSRLERVAIATERGDQPLVRQELDQAAQTPADPGEARALVNVALTLGTPETAAAILEQVLSKQPDSVDALRLLLEVQRQRHRARDMAALDERIYRLTGDPDALREAADIYASQRMTAERIDALRRLDAIGRATPSDMAELAHRLADAGHAREALALLMGWLARPDTKQLPPDLVGLAAVLSADSGEAARVAAELGALIGRAGQDGPLHILIQTYAERGRPELSLLAAHRLGEAMTWRPDVALLLAQLEALQGDLASARHRLDVLDRNGTLLPAGLPMLMELSLQAADLARAVTLLASLPADQISESLPHRLVEALYGAGRSDLLARLPVAAIAESSPASAAVIALSQGDRARAALLAQAALGPAGDLADLGPAFGDVVRALGLEREATARLVQATNAGALEEGAFALLLGLADSTRADVPALLQALRSQRDLRPRAGVVWAVVAARSGRAAEVAVWVQSQAVRLPAQSLLDLLLLAAERGDAGLTRATAAALAGRTDLPFGWTAAEITLTEHAREPLTPARLQSGLELIAAPGTTDAARDRLTALLVGARDFAKIAQTVRLPVSDGAVAWLVKAVEEPGRADLVAARLALLAGIAPQRALAALARRSAADPQAIAPLYAAVLLRSGQPSEAQAVLAAALRGLPPKQQDALLQETLARIPPGDALPVLRLGAALGREDWVAAYHEGLTRSGRLDELRADLRAQAAAPGTDAKRRQALAARLVELNDRPGAIAILQQLAAARPPADPAIEQLMFLWGPRAQPEAVAWTRARAMAAPGADLPKWLEHLAYLGDPQAVLGLVDRRPAALATSAAAVRAYGAALVAAHSQAKPDLRAAIAAATAPDLLIALAQLGLDTGQAASAWQAARAALAAAPSDPAALRLAAQSAAAARRSEDAASFYARLLATGPQPVEVSVDAGDSMLTAKRGPDGRRVLAAALARLPPEPTTLAEARLRARTLMLLRRDGEALALLNAWLARYPGHAGLRADLLQARLDETR